MKAGETYMCNYSHHDTPALITLVEFVNETKKWKCDYVLEYYGNKNSYSYEWFDGNLTEEEINKNYHLSDDIERDKKRILAKWESDSIIVSEYLKAEREK